MTPNSGGWSISERERESVSGITVNDTTGRSVARVPPRDDDLDIARLIAAAPDLLAALKNLISHASHAENLVAGMGLHGTSVHFLQMRQAQAEARAVIAKATQP